MLKEMNQGQPQPAPSHNFGMNSQQLRNAQGDALMNIAAEMGNPGYKGKGLNRMLGALVGSIRPVNESFNRNEAIAKQENMMMYKLAAEEERERKREQRDIEKMMRDEAYNNRYLNLMASRGQGRAVQSGSEYQDSIVDPATGNEYDLSKFPKINTKNTRDRYIKDADLIGGTINKIDHVEELISRYESMHPDEFLNPSDPIVKKYYNEARDVINRKFVRASDEEKKQRMGEYITRKLLSSELKQLNIASERAVTGRAMTQGMYDRLKDAYSDPNEPISLTKARIEQIKQELMPVWKSNLLSSSTGRAINPNRAKDFPDTLVDEMQTFSIKNKKIEKEDELSPGTIMEMPENDDSIYSNLSIEELKQLAGQ
jgi:hypothetical protein